MSETLKPCPFCTCAAQPVTMFDGGDPARVIRCRNCGAVTARFLTEAEAIAAWNQRPGDAVTEPVVFHPDSTGEFDETWFRGANVHIERMSDTSFWIGFDMPGDKRVMLNTGVCRGVWYFNLEEDCTGGGHSASIQRPRRAKPATLPKHVERDAVIEAAQKVADAYRVLEASDDADPRNDVLDVAFWLKTEALAVLLPPKETRS